MYYLSIFLFSCSLLILFHPEYQDRYRWDSSGFVLSVCPSVSVSVVCHIVFDSCVSLLKCL